MSCLMSLLVCILNFGFVENLLHIWLKSWSTAFVVAYPVVLVVSPLVGKLVALIFDDSDM
jgi:hypothetical protein